MHSVLFALVFKALSEEITVHWLLGNDLIATKALAEPWSKARGSRSEITKISICQSIKKHACQAHLLL